MIHFGLESIAGYVLYGMAVVAFFLSIFWRPVVGIYYLIPLIPLQTVRYHLNGFPLGQSVIDVMLLGVIVGLWVRGEQLIPKTPWNGLLAVYGIFTFVSLCLGSLQLRVPLPLSPSDQRLADWKNYMIMPILLVVVAASAKGTKQMKIVIVLMCLAVLLFNRAFWDTVSGREFANFSYDLQDNGETGYVGVNGLAAFEAQMATFLVAVAGFERKRLLQYGYWALAIFSATCLMYSLSRGGYLAFLAGCLFLGLAHQRKILVLLVVFAFTWSSFLPGAVQQRVQMTYDKEEGKLDHSSQVRVDLWEEGLQLFDAHPWLGLGFNTYAYMNHPHGYRDSHNIYVKVLVETGAIGLLLFLWLLARLALTGFWMFRRAKDPLLSSLGLGLATWLACSVAASFFGDRWTHLQINGYLWVIAGLVARGIILERACVTQSVRENNLMRGVGEAMQRAAGV
jgi:putative inorganic carbon (hco3(-)) transporter